MSRSARRPATALCAAAWLVATPPAGATDPTSMSLEQLLQVKVVGASKYEQKQGDVAAAVTVLTRRQIRDFGWTTLAEALGSLPGVHTTYDRQYTYLGMRGFGLPGDLTARLLITIDGNRVNDPVYDGGPGGRELPLDLDLVERIEFIPGPGGAVYGQNAMFGVVNIVTRRGADVAGTEVALATQWPHALRQGRLSWGGRTAHGVDMLLSLTAARARGADEPIDFGGAAPPGRTGGLDGEGDLELFARAAAGPWAAELVFGNRRKDDPTGAFFSDPLVPGQYSRDRYLLAQAQFDDTLSGTSLRLSGRVFAGSYRFDSPLRYGTWVSFPAAGDWRGLELRALSGAFAGHTLMAGLEWQSNTRIAQAVLDHADPTQDFRTRKTGYRVGLYGQDEWQLGASLTATLGLRIDRNDVTGTRTSPRGALIWQASPATTWKLLAGRAHRAPNAYESDYDDGVSLVDNPKLRGERIDTYEVVADHRVGPDLALRASLYRWDIHGLIKLGIDPASGLPQYQDGDRVVADGIELSADRTWRGGTRLRGSLSYQEVADANGARLTNSPRLLGRLNLSTPLPWAGLQLGYELRHDSRRLSLDGTPLGGHAVSNLHLSTAALARGVDVALGVLNLFDKRHAHPAADTNWQNAFAQDGRSVRLTVRLGF